MTDTRRRVKLYALNAERQWDDKGTGHVSSTYVERLKGISLLVRAEADGKNILLYIYGQPQEQLFFACILKFVTYIFNCLFRITST